MMIILKYGLGQWPRRFCLSLSLKAFMLQGSKVQILCFWIFLEFLMSLNPTILFSAFWVFQIKYVCQIPLKSLFPGTCSQWCWKRMTDALWWDAGFISMQILPFFDVRIDIMNEKDEKIIYLLLDITPHMNEKHTQCYVPCHIANN